MGDWDERIEVRKGNAGERALDRWLNDQGIIPYAPTADGPHPFDRICAMPNKRQLFIAEAKAKPARRYYPDTGIDERHYNDYLHKQQAYGLHVFMVFVDEDRAQVYGEFLSVLDQPRSIWNPKKDAWFEYPLIQNAIRYWPLAAMRTIAQLTTIQRDELRALSTRNKRYVA